MAEKQRIIGVTGYSSAGKSTLARHLSAQFGTGLFSLGDYQRRKFAAYGSTPQEYHGRLGLAVTYYGLWPAYVSEIKARMSGAGIVIEGVYTYAFLEMVRGAFPEAETRLLRVSSPYGQRLRTFALRTGLETGKAKEQMDALDRIKDEVGLKELLRHADSTVVNRGALRTFLRRGELAVAGIAGGDACSRD